MHETNTRWWQYPWNLFTSKLLAVILIALLAIFSAIGMIIPQTDPNPGNYQAWAIKFPLLAPLIETLGLNNLFRTWWFATLGVIFFTNLAACTARQIQQSIVIWRRRRQPIQSAPLAGFAAAGDYGFVRAETIKAFARAGYSITDDSGDDLMMEKHRWGIWGSVVFHIGLIVVVFAVLLTGAVKTTGYMMVAEGETRREIHDNYDVIYQGPFFKTTDHYGFEITMKKQQKYFDEKGRLDYIKSDVLISENGLPVLEKQITRGEPLLYKDIRFFEYDDGFAPLVTLKKGDGSVAWQTYLLLNTHRYSTRRTYYYNNLSIPGTPYTMTMEFYPEMAFKGKTVYNRSNQLKNPGAKIVIREKGRVVAEKVIKKEEPLVFGGYRLNFGEIKSWTGLEVVRDPGAGILFGGFWLNLAGLIVLYFLRYQKVQLNLAADGRLTRVKVCHYALRHRKILADDITSVISGLVKKFDSRE